MAQVSNEGDSKKLLPLTVPKIIEQLERALNDIKYNQSDNPDELYFNKIENEPIESKTRPRSQFIGKELMLFEMIGILNGKISELEKKYQKLKVLEEREEEFLSSKANEITEPIQDIFEYGKLVKSGCLDSTEALNKVLEIAKKLQNVTTIVLDTNRIANDKLVLAKKNHNINEIILEIVNIANSQEPKIPIRIGLDHDIEIPVDRVRLGQVIQTILNNSIKYTDYGYIKVESFVAHEQNLVIIRINDTGAGIPSDVLPRIFEKGVTENRIEDSTPKLNLYLCRGIVEAHGGTMTAKNNSGKGCTLTITLPIKKSLEHLR